MNFKITVLKKMGNPELAEQHCVKGASVCPCPLFQEGQEFVTKGLSQPEGFCSWAWDDLFKYVTLLFCKGSLGDYMKREDTIVACCTDGIRPVVFKLERTA